MPVKRLLLVVVCALALPASALAWGGVYPANDSLGSTVNVQVSDSYPVDQTLPQDWATYLGTLVHGPELSKLTLRLMPISDVQRTCGAQALACYDNGTETIYATPDDQLGSPPAKEIVAHEYGHHIAANRSNAPFSASDYGTKRWASYENICAKSASGQLSPGNESGAYSENPGEVFAESYRVLNLTQQGDTNIDWSIVDPAFYPNATALRLLEEDVLDPWTHNTVTVDHGAFGHGEYRTFGVATALDGSFVASLHEAARAHLRLLLYAGSTLVASSASSIHFQICGQRVLTLRVQRLRGPGGAFTVDVSKP